MDVVLFACVHNAGRSQMAAAWFNKMSDPMKARAISAAHSQETMFTRKSSRLCARKAWTWQASSRSSSLKDWLGRLRC